MSNRNVNTQIDILRQLQQTISQNIDKHAAGVEKLKQIIDVQSQLIDALSEKLDIHVAYVEVIKQDLFQKQEAQSQLIDAQSKLIHVLSKKQSQFPDLDSLQKHLESNNNLEFELEYKL